MRTTKNGTTDDIGDRGGNARLMLVAGIMVVGVGAGLYLLMGRSSEPVGPEVSPEFAQGRVIYEVNCAECHGKNATGDGPLAAQLPIQPPSILDHLAHHTEEVLIQIAQDGIPPAMPPVGISEDDARIMFDYLESLLPAGVTIGSTGSMEMPMGGMPMEMGDMEPPMGEQGEEMPVQDSAASPN